MKPKISIKVGNGHDPVEMQKAVDTDLQTTNKTIVGAINELHDEITNMDIGDVDVIHGGNAS